MCREHKAIWCCAWNLHPPCISRHIRHPCPVWNYHGPRGSWNLLENRAHMVASVPVLTCHVTAVMGLSMAAQTTGSQEPVSCGSWGRGWEEEVSWSAGRSKIMISKGGGGSKSQPSGAQRQPSFMCDCDDIAWMSSRQMNLFLKNIWLQMFSGGKWSDQVVEGQRK